jgi:hypothetical protein
MDMTDNQDDKKEPQGFTEETNGHSSEAAQEQGWDLNEDERTSPPKNRPAHYGGKGFDYGAQDFGDAPEKRDNPGGVSDEDRDEKKAS